MLWANHGASEVRAHRERRRHPVTVEFVDDEVHDLTLSATEVQVPYAPGTTNILFNVRWGQQHFARHIREGLYRDLVLGDPARSSSRRASGRRTSPPSPIRWTSRWTSSDDSRPLPRPRARVSARRAARPTAPLGDRSRRLEDRRSATLRSLRIDERDRCRRELRAAASEMAVRAGRRIREPDDVHAPHPHAAVVAILRR